MVDMTDSGFRTISNLEIGQDVFDSIERPPLIVHTQKIYNGPPY